MSNDNIIPFDPVSPCFAHPGGKRKLLKHILPLLPEHKQYVEPFAGGLAVLLAKPRARAEVINDLDREVANFYRYLRYHKESLLRELEGCYQSREDFALLLANPGHTDLQRAVRWYLLKVNSFGAQGENFGRANGSYHGFDRARHLVQINAVAERLSRVTIECQDWDKVASFYDSADTLHFFDPPYVNCGATSYQPFSEFDMGRVRARLNKLKGQWLLTCDDSPQCRTIFAGLPHLKLQIRYTLANTRGNKTARSKQSGEMLIACPAIAERHAAANWQIAA